jgi:methionine-gamma-lyase
MAEKTSRPLKIGITGGIGAGKTRVSTAFEALGMPVLLTDLLARQLIDTDLGLRAAIAALLGDEAFLLDGSYNRAWVAKQVFADRLQLERLNALVHPVVFAHANRWQEQQIGQPYALRESALLLESGHADLLDAMIVVVAPEAVRIARVVARDGLTHEQVEARLRNQLPDAQRVARAHFVINNDGIEPLEPQIAAIHQQLLAGIIPAIQHHTAMHIETLSAKEVKDPVLNHPHVLPIYASSSFVFEDAQAGERVFRGEEEGFSYSRYGNPTVDAVAGKIALLEQYHKAIPLAGRLTSSGQSAVAGLCMAILQQGDAILTQGDLYGGTTELFNKVLKPFGIDIIAVDFADLANVEQLLASNPKIKVVYVETPANPTLACYDIAALAQLGRSFGCEVVADNTFATPYHCQPMALGCTFVIHSTTKFLSGHGNMIGGIIIAEKASPHWDRINAVVKLTGGTSNAFEAWLTHNGLKTFALRMRAHSDNALALATWLAKQPGVTRVNYPGLPSHVTHQIAKKQMQRGFGGMLSFELAGGYEAAVSCLNKLRLATQAPTLGDVDTLVLHPHTSSHLRVSEEIRSKYGITPGLMRVSVGIEHIDDIIADFEQAIG